MRLVVLLAGIVGFAMTSGAAAIEIEAPGPQGPLAGTLLPAAGATGLATGPIVLIVPGSGPTDRDGNSPLGIRASAYRLLAEGLAARGISTVRIDMRGMFASARAVPDANAVTIADYAQDVRAWVGAIRAKTGAPCVWVLGHSEGGLVALAAAAGNDAGICGLVLAAAPGRPLGEVLREQFSSNPANAPILAEALAAVSALEAGRRPDVARMHPALRPIFDPKVQDFLIDTLAVDPARLIADCRKPVLILQGERDLQTSVTDAERLKAAAPQARLVLLPDTNHVLKKVGTADRSANLGTYGDPHLPLAPGVVDAIAGFVAPTPGNR
ncbi:alpha/beta hydrolase [Mesorhizobium sp. PUT5]|uniref:alpha/beta hydrolase n=1 Tax=Mesorhizobium sp. PUT5 TaxID=3454629 RepID=UPI003FA4284F